MSDRVDENQTAQCNCVVMVADVAERKDSREESPYFHWQHWISFAEFYNEVEE